MRYSQIKFTKKENEDDPQNRIKQKWKVVQVLFLFFLWAVRPMLFYRAMAARGPQDSSPSGDFFLCALKMSEIRCNFEALKKTMTYPFLSIFAWVLVHMMLGDYLWPILRLNWPIKNCTFRAKRLQDHSRQGLSVYHALGLVPMCDHHRIRELHHVNTCKLWSQADGIGRLCTIVQLIISSLSQIEKWNHRAIEPSSWNILLSASIQGTCSVSLSMIFWVRPQVATRLDLRFVYIWVISFHLNMIFVSCFIYFGLRFCHISNTLQGLVKDFEAGCCSRVVWSACQRPGVALFHSSKALSSHCSLARCLRCALRKRVFQHGQWCWSNVEASKWSLKRYAKM